MAVVLRGGWSHLLRACFRSVAIPSTTSITREPFRRVLLSNSVENHVHQPPPLFEDETDEYSGSILLARKPLIRKPCEPLFDRVLEGNFEDANLLYKDMERLHIPIIHREGYLSIAVHHLKQGDKASFFQWLQLVPGSGYMHPACSEAIAPDPQKHNATEPKLWDILLNRFQATEDDIDTITSLLPLAASKGWNRIAGTSLTFLARVLHPTTFLTLFTEAKELESQVWVDGASSQRVVSQWLEKCVPRLWDAGHVDVARSLLGLISPDRLNTPSLARIVHPSSLATKPSLPPTTLHDALIRAQTQPAEAISTLKNAVLALKKDSISTLQFPPQDVALFLHTLLTQPHYRPRIVGLLRRRARRLRSPEYQTYHFTVDMHLRQHMQEPLQVLQTYLASFLNIDAPSIFTSAGQTQSSVMGEESKTHWERWIQQVSRKAAERDREKAIPEAAALQVIWKAAITLSTVAPPKTTWGEFTASNPQFDRTPEQVPVFALFDLYQEFLHLFDTATASGHRMPITVDPRGVFRSFLDAIMIHSPAHIRPLIEDMKARGVHVDFWTYVVLGRSYLKVGRHLDMSEIINVVRWDTVQFGPDHLPLVNDVAHPSITNETNLDILNALSFAIASFVEEKYYRRAIPVVHTIVKAGYIKGTSPKTDAAFKSLFRELDDRPWTFDQEEPSFGVIRSWRDKFEI